MTNPTKSHAAKRRIEISRLKKSMKETQKKLDALSGKSRDDQVLGGAAKLSRDAKSSRMKYQDTGSGRIKVQKKRPKRGRKVVA